MRASLAALLALTMSSCSSAPARERSAHADGSAADAQGPGEEPAPRAATPEPATADDVSAQELETLRQRLGCTREGPPQPGSHGVACGLLGRFARGRAPVWTAGSFPGVVLALGADFPDVAAPALLAVRGRGASAEVAWGRIEPADPTDATALTAMAADVLEGHAPAPAPEPWPGLGFARPAGTGVSAQLAATPRTLARSEGDDTLVVIWIDEEPLVAVHRAGHRATP